jgi:hypothetical protein
MRLAAMLFCPCYQVVDIDERSKTLEILGYAQLQALANLP